MKTRFSITLLVISFSLIAPLIFSSVYATCMPNEDWPKAPCLDTIGNGRYDQEEVNQWTDYYSYKGSIFMEQKYLAMNDAIEKNLLKEWVGMSPENQNVYDYYFFSGRAPNIGLHYGQFDIIEVNEEGTPELGKPTLPNLRPVRDYDYGLINLVLVFSGLAGGGIAIAVALIKKKRK
jgi:hypothetical protein